MYCSTAGGKRKASERPSRTRRRSSDAEIGIEAARETMTPRSGTRPPSTVAKPPSTPISRKTFCAASLSVSNGLPTRGTITSRASRATRRGSRHESRSRNVSEPTKTAVRGTPLFPHLAVALHHELRRGQLAHAHRPARVHAGRGNSHLGPHPELI